MKSLRSSRRQQNGIIKSVHTILAGALFGLSLVALDAQADSEASEIRLARQCFKAEQFISAVRHFNQVVKADPNNANYHFERGVAILELKDKDGALADFEFCKKTAPNIQIAQKYWAPAYRAAGKYQEALDAYTNAIKLDPKSVDMIYGRAQTYVEHDQFAKAIDDYDQTIKLRPNVDYYYSERAQTYSQLKQWAKAIADFDRTLKINKENKGIFLRRAQCYVEVANYKAALSDFDLAIKDKPGQPKAYALRAKAYDRMGRKDLADADRKKARELGEDFAL